jgi:membrane protein DedA with SNARE-associated domain
MTGALISFVGAHGLLGVLLLMTVESCGVPVPSEVVMPLAGALAGAGHLNLAWAILCGAAGNLAGSLIAYGLAARFGIGLLLGPGARLGISRRHLELADRWFERYGLVAVFLGRLVPVVRTYISFPAGLAQVPPGRFCLLTFLGALPWSAALAMGGYLLGSHYASLSSPIEMASIACAAVVLVILVVWFVRGRRSGSARREVT